MLHLGVVALILADVDPGTSRSCSYVWGHWSIQGLSVHFGAICMS